MSRLFYRVFLKFAVYICVCLYVFGLVDSEKGLRVVRGLYGCWRGFGRVVSEWIFEIGIAFLVSVFVW